MEEDPQRHAPTWAPSDMNRQGMRRCGTKKTRIALNISSNRCVLIA